LFSLEELDYNIGPSKATKIKNIAFPITKTQGLADHERSE
jgi:hypothetical protein